MYGFTGFSTGSIKNSTAYIPVQTMMEGGSNRVNLKGRTWQRMISTNKQPEFVNSQHLQLARERVEKNDAISKACVNKIKDRVLGGKDKELKEEDE